MTTNHSCSRCARGVLLAAATRTARPIATEPRRRRPTRAFSERSTSPEPRPPRLPKLAVMPIVTTSDADTTLQLVVKKDLDLSGQFEVVDDDARPSGLYLHDSPVDVAAWRGKGINILVRVLANKLPSGKIELLGSAYLARSRRKIRSSSTASRPTPRDVRTSSHRMTDALLGALTGRPGGFASHMVYSGRVGKQSADLRHRRRRLQPARREPRSATRRSLPRLVPRARCTTR